MKARKSFCPLDPVYPPARLAQALDDLDAHVLLTGAAQSDLAAAALDRMQGRRPRIIDVGRLESGERAGPGCAKPAPGDLAWIIFTSGSTGQPKGVTQNHGNALAMTESYIELAAITPDDG